MTIRSLLAAVWVSLSSAIALSHSSAIPASAADAPYKVLVFSKTAGFHHSSIPKSIKAIQMLGAVNNFTVTATEDATTFTESNLAQFQTAVFMSTTGDLLNDSQQSALEAFIRQGGGYVGIHAAADTEYAWPFYGMLVGAWFASHPAIQQATVNIEEIHLWSSILDCGALGLLLGAVRSFDGSIQIRPGTKGCSGDCHINWRKT